jgi:hypothetical protein
MATGTLEKLVWILIYGGLLLICLGVFVQRGDSALGWALAALGVVFAVAGVVLIGVRSRMPDTPSQEQEGR